MDVHIDDRGKFFTQRVSKESVAAMVRITDYLVVGHVYVKPDHRLKDELNGDSGRFLAVTEACVYDTIGERLLFKTSFLLISYKHVIMLSPLEEISGVDGALWAENHDQEEA